MVKNFRALLESLKLKSITFFDIDETLFSTHAKIHIIKGGKVIKKLSNQEFNNYVLNDGESFDFFEFKDSELFSKTSEPIQPIIQKLKAMFKNIKAAESEMYLLTARPDFDNKKRLLDFLNAYGIEAGHVRDKKIHVIRAGNRPGKDSADRKKQIVKEFLETKEYYKARLYDDDINNLKEVLSLNQEFKNIQFEMFHIDHGKVKSYK